MSRIDFILNRKKKIKPSNTINFDKEFHGTLNKFKGLMITEDMKSNITSTVMDLIHRNNLKIPAKIYRDEMKDILIKAFLILKDMGAIKDIKIDVSQDKQKKGEINILVIPVLWER